VSALVTLHVGLPRTGTTSLQLNLFNRHPELAYLGKPQHFLHAGVGRLLRGLTELDDAAWSAALPGLRERVVAPWLARPGPHLLSEEELSTGTLSRRVSRAAIADRLVDLFPGARVILCVRRQPDLVRSLYCHLRGVGLPAPPFGRWLEGELTRGGWLSAFDHDDLWRAYAARFGADSVHILVYEDLVAAPEAFIRGLCDHLGVHAEAGWSLWTEGPRRNRSAGVDAAFAPGQRRALEDAYRRTNRHLSARLGLALQDRGYAT